MTVQPIVASLALIGKLTLIRIAPRLLVLIGALLLWLGAVLAKYVRGPIALYRMGTRNMNPKMRLVSESETIQPDVLQHIQSAESALVAAGFSPPQRITIQSENPLSAVESLLEHTANGDLVNVVALLNTSPTAKQRLVTSVSFRSALADGTTIITSNSSAVGFWPVEPTKRDVNLPDVRDPLEMYRLHRARLAHTYANVAQKKLTRGETPAQWLAYATRQWLDSTNYLIKAGYRKRSPDGIRITALGATLVAWRRMFPWKQLLEWKRRRAAAEVMRLA